MEYLRRCYSTFFKIYVGGVEVVVPARWYFAPKGAKLFKGASIFASQVWAKIGEESAPGPGEISRDRVWDRGLNPGYLGKCTVGEPSWFASGELPAGVLDPPIPALPDCCRQGHLCGAVIGGVLPDQTRLRVAGATGLAAAFNGDWTIPYDHTCDFTLIPVAGDGILWNIASAGTTANPWGISMNLRQGGVITSGTAWLVPSNTWDGTSAVSAQFTSFFGGGTPPTSVILGG
jgi:hypothetical protein